jgi:hypothetical protein
MPVSLNNTQVVFNDATTQTTAGVTSIVAGTGISSSGGLTPTIANTGVTSVTAGTGISVSAGTGGVTITNSSPGGVTSLNGQTGAITSTNYNAIGSYFVATNSSYGPNATIDSTISGSSLNIQTSDGVFASAGLTGTWRAMGGSAVRSNSGAGLFVRIS